MSRAAHFRRLAAFTTLLDRISPLHWVVALIASSALAALVGAVSMLLGVPGLFPVVLLVCGAVWTVLVCALLVASRRWVLRRVVMLLTVRSLRVSSLPAWVLEEDDFPHARRWLDRRRLSPAEVEVFTVLAADSERSLGELVGAARLLAAPASST